MSATFQFCPHCAKPHSAEEQYCYVCGFAYPGAVVNEHDYHSPTPITYANFLPRLLNALEEVSIRYFFRTLQMVWYVSTRPRQYVQLEQQGRVVPVFVLLIMATFAGALKWTLDPAFQPIMQALSVGYDITESLLDIVLYTLLATAFGFFALTLAFVSYWLLPIHAARDAYVRAMLNVFNLYSFVECGTSPLWMPLVKANMMPWGAAEGLRAVLILVYARLVYVALAQQQKTSPAT